MRTVKTIVRDTTAEVIRLLEEDDEGTDKRWNNPDFWERVTVGRCAGCGGGHVLKDGRCWHCRVVTP
jgi:hypothetical protein